LTRSRSKALRPAELVVDRRIAELLDCLVGQGSARQLLRRLLTGAEAPSEVAETIAASPALELLYKRSRTLDVGVEGLKPSDPEFVGLHDLPLGLPFSDQFRGYFSPRLGKKAAGFAVIFDALHDVSDLLIVETGCMRIPANWEGDGQSTFMFDSLVQQNGGAFFSIDVSVESIDTARRACSHATQLILNDSIFALHTLDRTINKRVDLLYLDSFDFDFNNPLPSSIHHMLELTASRSLVGPGTIVCIDDYALGPDGGKGMLVDRFFSNIRTDLLHTGYQKIWRVR